MIFEALLEFLDRPAGRLTILFLFALALFLNRSVPQMDDVFSDTGNVIFKPSSDEPPVVQRAPEVATSWRDYSRSRFRTPRTIPRAYESMVNQVKTDLIRLGYGSPAVISMLAAYADRRAWFQVEKQYEQAIRDGDVDAAIAALVGALEGTRAENVMLKRDLLSRLLNLQTLSGDSRGAEATFRKMVEARKKITSSWRAELRSNPALAKKLGIDPEFDDGEPTEEQIGAAFDAMTRRSAGGGNPFLLTEREWESALERVRKLKVEGKVEAGTVEAVSAWRTRYGRGSP